MSIATNNNTQDPKKRKLFYNSKKTVQASPASCPVPDEKLVRAQNDAPDQPLPAYKIASAPVPTDKDGNAIVRLKFEEQFPNRLELFISYDEAQNLDKRALGLVWWPEEKIWVIPSNDVPYAAETYSKYAGEYLAFDDQDKPEVLQMGCKFRPQSCMWWGAVSGAGQKYGIVYLPKTKFLDSPTLRNTGCKWGRFFRIWYTSKKNFEANKEVLSQFV